MKIAIIGSGGAGKTTLAYTLSEYLHIPVYYLDQYRWKPGWKPVDSLDVEQVHNELCDKDMWIIDGNYTKTLPYRFSKADIIIFLDVPRWKRLYRIVKRRFIYRGTQRPDQPDGCKERLTWGFVLYTWYFDKKVKPTIMKLFDEYKDDSTKKIYIIKNNAELKALLPLELDNK